ncbi:umecyanin-like [Amaranthus tricolor]|uniref:umecyanin-like n=1 Tax=Amaranthus tricolor TaxID=29722 RepID=UPI002586E722|nr:umecyanin-like [Amaranthus tricolor]
MGCRKKSLTLMIVVAIVFVYGGKQVDGQVHHVVGQDSGWDAASDIASWAAGRTFLLGDFLWFGYSSGLHNDYVVELKTKEEFESCDVSNPIKMYINGVDKISFEEEGIRYFASANPDKCKKGLKFPVETKSKSTAEIQSSSSMKTTLALEPTAPSSSSTKFSGSALMIIAALIIYQMGV